MSPTAARTAGAARTRLNKALTKHLVADFDAYGAEAIAKLRKEKPVDYLKLVTAILEKEDGGEATLGPSYNIVERQIVPPPHRHG